MGWRDDRFSVPLGSPAGDGVDRRDFVKACMMAAAAVGLPASVGVKWAEAAAAGLKPSVIWLHFQECTGCTESLLRTTHPGLAELILDLISLDYCETLAAAAGYQVEDALHSAMEQHAGSYICVVEGAIPTKDDGIYCKIAGRTAIDILNEVGEKAGAIIAIGSCASWGGIPSADPNPTGAVGAHEILEGKTVVNLPGCPANPYTFLGTALQYVSFGTLPELDDKNRPLVAYGRTIHEHCPRRAHFDAGRFARQYGDEGHRLGYCLFALGCKGPETHAPCSVLHFGEIPDAWPIGVGHPCFGCTEKGVGFHKPLHQESALPEGAVPPIFPDHRSSAGAAAAGVAGLVGGAVIGAGLMASKKVAEGGSEEGSS
ncbi:MAG TPA: hydrogenase small subunit [Chondromyces sp.]|nr:hydrogenase small subunit [Chondromyces sp.]